MTTFADATRVVGDSGEFTWAVPDGWQQGRGAWGGLVIGALVNAVVACEPDPVRAVRSVSIQMMAPALPVTHRVAVTRVRAGSAMTTWAVSASGPDGEAVANGVVITGGPRTEEADDHAEWGITTMPAVASASQVPRVPSGPPFPVFAQHLAYQPVSGLPLSGASASTSGWLSYGEPTPLDAAALLALVDGWWTANVVRASGMPRIATVNFLATLLVDPGTLDPAVPLLSQSWVAAAHEGFTSEHRTLWAPDGRLVVDNVQTVVVGA